LYKSDGSRYLYNPFIDEQSIQIDIDGDGLEDLFYFEGYDLQINPTPNPPPSIFMNNGTILKQSNYTGATLKDPHGTKLLIGDFNNDSLPDIFSNVAVDPPIGVPFPYLNDNCHLLLNSKNGFSSVKEFLDQGFWYTGCSGDIDNDGDLDIITFNFHSQSNGVKSRIMWNDGKANFSIDFNGIGDIPVADQSELVDINNDGFLDLVINFHPNGISRINDFRVLWGNGIGFSLSNSTSISMPGNWYLMNLDFLDIDKDGTKEIVPSGNYDNPSGGAPIYFISFYKSENKGQTFTDKTSQFIDNNKANRFYHIRVQDIDKNGLIDIFSGEKKDNIRWEWNGNHFVRNYCNNFTKPLFNTTKYSFCSGDSLKLAVTNTNKGDTLKWYYGTKSDVTNISNKTFTDSTKLFVTRTDSVGCIISSDTIQLTKYYLPNKPTLAWNGTQFTATTTSTGVNYQWLLNNSSVSGATSATYKPTAIGSYKIQITDANGCKNVSDSFSLVVTAVNPSFETSANHIAKIAPNPASTDVSIYFQQKPNKTLTIRVLNLNGQVLKQITTNSQSTRISLSEIIAGNYIIEIIGKGYNQTQQLLITK
jgi:hypothetical protein